MNGSQKMRVSLVFPPPFDITQPYLSVPTLSAILKQQGYQTTQRDLNVEVFDHFVNSATLAGIYERICEQLDDKVQDLSSSLYHHKIKALERAQRICPLLIPRCSEIKRGFRTSGEFLDPTMYSRNIRLLHRVCETVSAAYFPTVLTPNSYRMKYRRSFVAEILAALDDERENLFLALFRDVFCPSLLEDDPDLVGISVVYSDQIIPALTLAKLLKRARRGTCIVIGGDVFSRMACTHSETMSPFFDLVDAFVIDDGGQPLLSICERLQDGKPFDSIPRVLTRESDHVSPSPANPDSIPTPDYGGLATELYFSPEPILSLLAGKGCQWGRCAFCAESFRKNYSSKAISSLLNDIDTLVREFNVKWINFADLDMPFERLRELADGLLARTWRISWSSRARLVKGFDDDLCRLIARAGCRKLYFGLESASQRVLNRMRKGILIDRVPEILKCCWANGIATHLFALVGFPGETLEEARMTSEFLVANREYVSSFNIGNFYFRTGSDIFREAEKYGVKSTHAEDVDAELDQQDYVVEHGMQMEEAEELSYVISREAYERISIEDDRFEFFPASRYVNRKGYPAFDSHNLAYLAQYSNRWTPGNGTATPQALNAETRLTVRPFIEIGKESNDRCIVFCPESAKILRLPVKAIELLRACDGRTAIGSLMSRHRDADPRIVERRGLAEVESADAPLPAEVLVLLTRALKEGIVAEVEHP
ncbi:MAG: radical SAM protein [bacterium]|nr:radical SAM protein [bacterium]